MIISGIVIITHPDKLEDVGARIDKIPWVDVHFSDAVGRMVVVIEADDVEESMDRVNQLKALPHVIMAELSQYYTEDDESTPEWPDGQKPIRIADRRS
jgi:nitrate reductase NapD